MHSAAGMIPLIRRDERQTNEVEPHRYGGYPWPMETRLVILGAGTAGTMAANHLRKRLGEDWSITVVDRDDAHHYQPAYIFVPFGKDPESVVRSRAAQIHDGIDYVECEISKVDADQRIVELTDGRTLEYDWLIIASGTVIRPDLVPGMGDGPLWGDRIHTFYTLEGSVALSEKLKSFDHGRVLVHTAEMPIKCPVAPLEFTFLVEDHYRKRRLRHRVDISFVTPLDGAFTKPVASARLGGMLDDRSIRLVADFAVEKVDNDTSELVSYDGRRLPFDLLVAIPPHSGQQFIERSGLGNDAGFVPVDKHTLRSIAHDNIFVLGDASDIPTSKAGSVAHFATEVFIENFLSITSGGDAVHSFDGHANCFVESGRGQALLLDFNYDTQPLEGHFPVPGVGPMRLLKPTRMNHLGKLAFEHIYWRMLLPGRSIPVPTDMSMAGKRSAGE